MRNTSPSLPAPSNGSRPSRTAGQCQQSCGFWLDHERTLELLGTSRHDNLLLRAERDQLQAALAASQHESQIREDFAAMAAHELRTPLNTLHLQTQLRRLIPIRDSPASSQRDEMMLQRDERMIQNMVRLIDDMRDAGSMQREDVVIAPRPLDLVALVRRVVESTAEQARVAGCDLTCETPGSLTGAWDEFRLEQVLGNLLTNAMRYGAGRPIRISLSCNQTSASLVVQDHGRGIAAADLARIFGRFERVGDTSVAPGLGLGLYISDQIVRGHGGTMSVESHPGEGSTFTVNLPFTAETRAKR